MNFDGFGGLALAVVAGLWLLVFVPSWFKRSQERERGIVSSRPKTSRSKRSVIPARRASVDNFASLARDYAETLDSAKAETVDPRAWQRTELPEPRINQGTLEVVQLAGVMSLESARQVVEARTLEQHELDEILRRRRANG
jgi:hypothetical protein